MGLFQGKQPAKKPAPQDDAALQAQAVFDDAYRQELRSYGQQYFKQVIDESAVVFKRDLDSTIAKVSTELKDYMTTKLDATIAHVNTAITKQLEGRLVDYDRANKDAQDLAVQSLNRNAQALYDKYQQLSSTLQQTVASQEAMMISVFEENKARMTTVQSAQAVLLKSLQESVQSSEKQTTQLSQTFEAAVTEQQQQLTKVFDATTARIEATKQAQDAALATLNQSAQALSEQHQQLSQTMQKSVADQETMLVDVFEDNMAQVIEHYLLGALGDQYDMKAQLPLIIGQMKQNKQAIMDDMKL